MAQEIRTFDMTVPASTPSSNPFTGDLSFPPRQVVQIEILVPPGPRGQVGFSIGSAGVPVIPRNQGGWIIADDDRIIWPLDGLWDSGSWTLFAYNNGTYDHTLYVTFLLEQLAAPVAPNAGGLPLSSFNPPTPADNGGLPPFNVQPTDGTGTIVPVTDQSGTVTIPALEPVTVPTISEGV